MPAFVAAQSELSRIARTAENPFLKNKYASLDTIIDTVRPVLAKHKLAFIQTVSDGGVETVITHESGEWLSSGRLKITPQEAKGLSYAQTFGVATTYAKRYQLAGMLGVAVEEDTDGNLGDNKNLKSVNKQQGQPQQSAAPTPGAIFFDEEVQNEIQLLTDLQQLEDYWKKLKELHGDPRFRAAIEARKATLKKENTQYARQVKMLEACLTTADVEELVKNNPGFPIQLVNDRVKEIKKAEKKK